VEEQDTEQNASLGSRTVQASSYDRREQEMTEPIRLFVGMDPREWVGLSVFCSSVWRHASRPVQITPIAGPPSGGSNAFTMSRFIVPQLCQYKGWAIYADGSDMLCRADIAELYDQSVADIRAVHVVKHDYKTRFPKKYFGADNPDYTRKNWSSLMLMFCGHYAWRNIPEDPQALHRLSWIPDHQIGDLPPQWNYLVGEENQTGPAKIAHFTVGLPVWHPYSDCEYSDDWRSERERTGDFQPWSPVEKASVAV